MRRDRTHYFVFPEYLDKSLTRREGRRLPFSEAIDNPRLLEIKLAAEKLGYDYELRDNASYPRQWWESKGLILIEKRTSKLNTLREISSEIKLRIRPALEKKEKELVQQAKKRKTMKPPSRDVKRKPQQFKPKRRK
ncbi:MAG: signal recognition particle subunit SRP19/SEC65 family protein [Candidatus Hodarchaeota archaeon]